MRRLLRVLFLGLLMLLGEGHGREDGGCCDGCCALEGGCAGVGYAVHGGL